MTIQENNTSDGRLGRRHAVLHHLCAARPGDDWLVDRFSLLGVVCDLRIRRHARRDVLIPLRRALVTQSDLPSGRWPAPRY